RFALIQHSVTVEPHTITIDTSGLPPKPKSTPQHRASSRPESWKMFQPVVWQSGNQNTSGNNGGPGSPGNSPGTGAAGSSEPNGLDGDCSNPTNGSANGEIGQPGGIGGFGEDAGDGVVGSPGNNAGNQNIFVPDPDTNPYSYIANGGAGGRGGDGGF